jgi:hypothetical protein
VRRDASCGVTRISTVASIGLPPQMSVVSAEADAVICQVPTGSCSRELVMNHLWNSEGDAYTE